MAVIAKSFGSGSRLARHLPCLPQAPTLGDHSRPPGPGLSFSFGWPPAVMTSLFLAWLQRKRAFWDDVCGFSRRLRNSPGSDARHPNAPRNPLQSPAANGGPDVDGGVQVGHTYDQEAHFMGKPITVGSKLMLPPLMLF